MLILTLKLVKMRTLFTLLFLLFLYSAATSQDKISYKYSVSATAEYGFLIGHHSEMNRLSTRHFPSFRLYLGHKTSGSKEWHRKFRYPELGVGIYYTPLMFNDQLGQAFAAFGYIDQIFGKKDRNNFSFRFGFGPGIVTSKFDPKENNQNIAIGSNLNIFVSFEFQKAFRISKYVDFKIGVNMSHFSNTGMKMPNLGINLFSGQMSLLYRIGEQTLNTEEVIFDKSNRWSQEVLLNFGRKQGSVEQATATIINTRYQAIYSFTFKSAVIGSADLFFEVYDPVKYEYQIADDLFQAGIAIGYLLDMKQIQMSLQWGFYLYNKSPDYEAYYHRLGVKWVATEHLLVNVSLRTEWARARNLELGIGWRF